jgi:hypothetical protein
MVYYRSVGKIVRIKRKAKVIDITEAMDLVKFIDAHGGRLGAFRGWGAQRTPSSPPPPPPAALGVGARRLPPRSRN